MKRLICLAMVGCFWIGFAWAQPCQYDAQTSDGSCTNGGTCPYQDGCTELSFTPTCTGLYDIRAWTGDGQTNCCYGEYQSCVSVYDASTGALMGSCFVNHCWLGSCSSECPHAACLVANHTYKLFVCLLDCGYQTCGMPPPCTAYGRVKFHTASNCE